MMRDPEQTIGKLIDKQGVAFIASVDIPLDSARRFMCFTVSRKNQRMALRRQSQTWN
jgi:hypothetical protein